ncbi:hypothetical protein BDU57DRAFT_534211 [Ampelomyces quisqualis]|uniref:Uncharacterized protein n=1 Tax=Ampelomyces quisqualis TaxID=50730 RepID=A0A6A5QYB1_AMPQU|nr:hypothetical protein BDU57DRAFT_534211 [Ampelomyces quisqualis]
MMHGHAPVEAPAPAPPTTIEHHHHHDIHPSPPPDSPPPSYDDATSSASAPLLVGAPPGYGTTFPDQSSVVDSELDESDRSIPEGLGQVVVIIVLLSITYAFWRIISAPDRPDGFPG